MLDTVKNALVDRLYKSMGRHRWNSALDQKKLVKSANTIFDVGANIGQTSALYRKLFPGAEIWAFEPVPESFQRLATRFKRDGRVAHPIHSALGDRPGAASMNRGPETLTDSMLLRRNRTGEVIDIRVDTVDAFCSANAICKLDILKVDVEGMEARVFSGAAEMFRKNVIQLVFTEVFFSATYEGMPLFWDQHALLGNLGFTLYGLYSLAEDNSGRLEMANALYVHN